MNRLVRPVATVSLAILLLNGCAASSLDAQDRGAEEATGTSESALTEDPMMVLSGMAQKVGKAFLKDAITGALAAEFPQLFPTSGLDTEALVASIDSSVRAALVDHAIDTNKADLGGAIRKLKEYEISANMASKPNARSLDQTYALLISDSAINDVDKVMAAVGPDARETYRTNGLPIFLAAAQLKASRLTLQMRLSPSTAETDRTLLIGHLKDAATHVDDTVNLLRVKETNARRGQIGECQVSTVRVGNQTKVQGTYFKDGDETIWTKRSSDTDRRGCQGVRAVRQAEADLAKAKDLDTKYAGTTEILQTWLDTVDSLEGNERARSSRKSSLAFGGFYGFGDREYTNASIGKMGCAAYWDYTGVYGIRDRDHTIVACTLPANGVNEGLSDFGGMYGYYDVEGGNGKTRDNPVTGGASCPAGFTAQQVLGARNTDWPMYACMRPHVDGVASPWQYGGSYTLDGTYMNQLTGGTACASGYTPSLVGGSWNADAKVVDTPMMVCTRHAGTAIALKDSKGCYVSAQNGGGSSVDSKGKDAKTWERFTLQGVGSQALATGSSVVLWSRSGKPVTAEPTGAVMADRSGVSTWERFTVQKVDTNGNAVAGTVDLGSTVALRTSAGTYLTATGGGCGSLSSSGGTIGSAQTFTIRGR